METKTLSYAHCRTHCHPSLMRVIGALQISTHKKQALNKFKGSQFPYDGIGPKQSPCPMEVRVACFLSFFQLQTFLQLSRKSKNCIETTEENSFILVERGTSKKRL